MQLSAPSLRSCLRWSSELANGRLIRLLHFPDTGGNTTKALTARCGFAQGLLWLTSLPSIHFSFAQGLLWLTSLPSIHFLDIRRQGLRQRRGRSSFLWRTVAKEKLPGLRTLQVVPVSTSGTRNRDSTLCDPRSGDSFFPATVRRKEDAVVCAQSA
jgi:hypothetical protein